jgi:hypothetical protein
MDIPFVRILAFPFMRNFLHMAKSPDQTIQVHAPTAVSVSFSGDEGVVCRCAGVRGISLPDLIYNVYNFSADPSLHLSC